MPVSIEKGFSLIETLIGLAIMGIIGVAILGALAMAARSNMTNSVLTQAETLARSQLEYIKSQPYDGANNYAVMSTTAYPGFSFDMPMTTHAEDNLQKITVTVKHNSDPLFTLVGYKVNR